MRANNISLEVLVNGTPITEYSKDGKRYLEGRKNNKYTLRIKNHTGRFVLVVPSVDGLSVLDGKHASRDSTGYVLEPHQTYDVKGWRISDDQVRAFQFTRKEASYGSKTGQAGNEGVIGLLAFYEKTNTIRLDYFPPITYNYNYNYPVDHTFGSWSYGSYDNSIDTLFGSAVEGSTTVGAASVNTMTASLDAQPSNSMGATVKARAPETKVSSVTLDAIMQEVKESQEATNLGTGMGKKLKSHVSKTNFDRENSPFAQISLYYFEKRQLERMGIVHKVPKGLPQAFPNEYCQEV